MGAPSGGNPFTSGSPELIACLKQGLGEELFSVFANRQKRPTQEEAKIIENCLRQYGWPGPGGPKGRTMPQEQMPPPGGEIEIDEFGQFLIPSRQGQTVDPAADYTDQRIVSAISSDGINFTREPGDRFAGSVPDVSIMDDGRYLALYVVPGEDIVRIAISEDGLNFNVFYKGIGRDDFAYTKYGCVDPTMIKVSDRYRLYCVGWEKPLSHKGGTVNHIITAVSSDGINWEDVRKIYSAEALSDVFVIKKDEGYIIYYSDKDDVYALYTPDGVSITKEYGKVIPAGNVAYLLDLNGKYRLYYIKSPRYYPPAKDYEHKYDLFTMTSDDGLTFSNEVGPILTLADAPSALKLPDGKIRIYYIDRSRTKE